jgi:hypothetical protein
MITPMKRILPIALVAALLGGSVGAFVMRSPKTSETTDSAATAPTLTPVQPASMSYNQATMTGEQAAYRDGFEEGFLAAQEKGLTAADYKLTSGTNTRNRVVNRTSRSRSVARNNTRAYYDYEQRQPQKRSFWQKHRDKLTVAAGAGGGALIGGLIGGKKGALIGGLAGGGGSALYTYKLRKRNNRN